MADPGVLYTPSGVRLRLRTSREGDLNWLFLPGGPGLGSESLHELAEALDVPGRTWMVDLPGDGSNIVSDASKNPFQGWPQILIEAAQVLPNCVYTGHSTGGMYLLSTPELENTLVGMALLSTAPDASWRSHYVATTQSQPLAGFDAALAAYEKAPSEERLRDLAVASAPWNFASSHVDAGAALLHRMPYNRAAVEWSDANFDNTYVSNWWPKTLPTMILAGANDRIVGQWGWDDPKYTGPHVLRTSIPRGEHFPWIENPAAVRDAYRQLASMIQQSRSVA